MLDFIKEWKGVSDDTLAISSNIANEILKHSKGARLMVSKVSKIAFREGDFDMDVTDLLNGLDKLNVRYTIYYCDDEYQRRRLEEDESLTCSADYFDAYIDIKVAFTNGKPDANFISDINHEINHILEVSKGFRKTKRGENLYDTATAIAQDNSKSVSERSPAFLIYYTFNHEEDSFAVQYYSWLRQRYTKAKELNRHGLFEKTLEEFTPYKNAMTALRIYNDHCNEPEVTGTIKAMNLTVSSFENRVNKGMKRLKNKLSKAYERLYIELNHKMASLEHSIRSDLMVSERYGHGICYGYEREYSFLND